MKKIASCLLVFVMLLSVFTLSGCGSKEVEDAEGAMQVYFSALVGFNTDEMKSCIDSGDEDDEDNFGFTIPEMSEDFIQTDNYKKAVKSMYQELGSTFVFTVDSNEKIDKENVEFKVTVKCANVNESDMGAYIQKKVDQYLDNNPNWVKMDEIEYSDTMIGVQADAYRIFLQTTERMTEQFTIKVTKIDGDWKMKLDENKEFFDFLSEVFAGEETAETLEPTEETTEEETVE